ncbi:MAG: hypothetical protein Q8O67_29085 [Deltaproteobacteria bacterium]|nr:hypothetical protein [Deltaproteobacteria bacterium]
MLPLQLALLTLLQLPAGADAVPDFRAFVSDTEASVVEAHLERALAAAFPNDAILRAQVITNVAKNLAGKRLLTPIDAGPFSLSVEEIKRTVIDYEVFKVRTYISSGVFPKRYFGYFDLKWDTAVRERTLQRVVRTSVNAINEFQKRAGSPVRVTDAEVAITFIAEGGALLLGARQEHADDVHPFAVGLDDLGKSLLRRTKLANELVAKTGSKFGDVIGYRDGVQFLRRNMTFEEAVVGTAFMWADEKMLASDKLKETERRSLADLSSDEQFVAGSLVFNSGLVFSPASRALIVDLATAPEMQRVSLANEHTRWLLPVLDPLAARERIRSGHGYPEQSTSWSAMYHVLQRYGAYNALRACTDLFDDDGMFRAR